jgi:hypothetical protein
MSKNILFLTEQTFKERTGASNAIDGKQLFPMIKVAGDMFIQPVLGSTLYKRLQEGVEDDNLSVNEKTLIDDYITDALIWFTMSMLPMSMGYQLFSKGFLQKTSEESTPPSRADLELIEQKYKSMAEFYNSRLISFLQENYTLYSEYLNVSMGLDTIFPTTKAYTCPIYLGGFERKSARYVNSSSTTPSPNVATYVAVGNETTFTIVAMSGRVTYFASRGGLSKSITTTASWCEFIFERGRC